MGLVVGTILAAINHYDMFLSGDFVARRVYQLLISYLVPFSVSLTSSGLTGRHHEMKSLIEINIKK